MESRVKRVVQVFCDEKICHRVTIYRRFEGMSAFETSVNSNEMSQNYVLKSSKCQLRKTLYRPGWTVKRRGALMKWSIIPEMTYWVVEAQLQVLSSVGIEWTWWLSFRLRLCNATDCVPNILSKRSCCIFLNMKFFGFSGNSTQILGDPACSIHRSSSTAYNS